VARQTAAGENIEQIPCQTEKQGDLEEFMAFVGRRAEKSGRPGGKNCRVKPGLIKLTRNVTIFYFYVIENFASNGRRGRGGSEV
jgi:hypothetical protein